MKTGVVLDLPARGASSIQDAEPCTVNSTESGMEQNNSQTEYIPVFKKAFYHPRYWGAWCGMGLLAGFAYVPPRLRDPVLGGLGRLVGKFATGARRRARINLLYCMPALSRRQREKIIDDMFACAPQSIALMAELACRDPHKVEGRIDWNGDQQLNQLLAEQKKIIFLVPHGWAVDVPAMLLASRGYQLAAFFHHQRNDLVDYFWNRARRRYGGRLHSRENGIKSFISSVRQGYCGYYLPDQDHGPEHSEFVEFFATYKATLPAIGRMMKICRATVVPLFPVYNAKTGRLTINVLPSMDDLAEADSAQVARRMNEEVEKLVGPNPEQYTWILKLLKTRKPGEIQPYKRKDI